MKKLLATALSLAALGLLTTPAPAWWSQCGCCQESYSFNFNNWPCCAQPMYCPGNFACNQCGGLPFMSLPPLPLPVSYNVLAYPPPSDYAPYARVPAYPPFAHTPEYGYDPGLEPPPLPPVSITTPGHPVRAPRAARGPKRAGWWNDALAPAGPCGKADAAPRDCQCCTDSCNGAAPADCGQPGKKRLKLLRWKHKASPGSSPCGPVEVCPPDGCASDRAGPVPSEIPAASGPGPEPAKEESVKPAPEAHCECAKPGYLPPPSACVAEKVVPACAQVVIAAPQAPAPRESGVRRLCRYLVYKPASWPQPQPTPPLYGPGPAATLAPCEP
jgi:hypothetical protein